MKWVIYRELRDFVKLHTHCRIPASFCSRLRFTNQVFFLDRVSGFRRGSDEIDLPTFPKTSVPLLNWLGSTNLRAVSDDHTTSTDLATSEAHNVNQEFARLQREALEEYMTKLIRAAVSHFHAIDYWRYAQVLSIS